MNQNLRRIKAIEAQNKKKLLSVNPELDNESGIYFLTRVDENGFKFAYIGQARHIIQRLVTHLNGYQHIDLSLKKHKLYSEENPYGWKINFLHYPESELDEKEQYWIKEYADKGYQLRNKTSGSQGEGKAQIADYKPVKGYRDGLAQGYKNAVRELKNIIDKHLTVSLREDKKNNKTSQKQFEKFKRILNEEEV